MARNFAASVTHQITTSLTGHAVARTWAIWSRRTNDASGLAGRLFNKGSGEALLNDDALGRYHLVRTTSGTAGDWMFARPARDRWCHLVVAHAGGTALPRVLLDGVPRMVETVTTPTGTLTVSSDPLRIGNRNGDRNFAGDLAELAVWDRLLTTSEALAVFRHGARSVPGVRLSVPLRGLASPEPEFGLAAGSGATVTGATYAPHAPVTGPGAPRWRDWLLEPPPPPPPGAIFARRGQALRTGSRGLWRD